MHQTPNEQVQDSSPVSFLAKTLTVSIYSKGYKLIWSGRGGRKGGALATNWAEAKIRPDQLGLLI